MRVITGRVVEGKIEIEEGLADGTPVAILAADEAGFVLSPEDEDALVTALEGIRRGNYVDGRDLLRELRQTGGR